MQKWIRLVRSRSAASVRPGAWALIAIMLGVLLLVSPVHAGGASAQDALRALKGLHSAVKVGLSYRDYGPRVVDARIIVDQFLEMPPPPLRPMALDMHRAMTFYEMGLDIWGAQLK